MLLSRSLLFFWLSFHLFLVPKPAFILYAFPSYLKWLWEPSRISPACFLSSPLWTLLTELSTDHCLLIFYSSILVLPFQTGTWYHTRKWEYSLCSLKSSARAFRLPSPLLHFNRHPIPWNISKTGHHSLRLPISVLTRTVLFTNADTCISGS